MSQSEFEVIRRWFAQPGLCFDKPGVELAIGDDAAVLQVPADKSLCVSTDLLAEGTHFPVAADPARVANRALAVNLSDLAAMGAEPLCFTLALAMPRADTDWLAAFTNGLSRIARRFHIPLVGGDTTKGPLSIAIQVHGLLPRNAAIRRDGARPGDRIYVSGTLGDGAIALAAMGLPGHLGESFHILEERLTGSSRRWFEAAYYEPEPRIRLAREVAHLVNSGIDVSDGLLADLGHITRASGVGAQVQVASLPRSDAAGQCTSTANWLRAALFGGDDYELCLSVPVPHCREFEARAAATGTPMTCIGEIITGERIRCVDATGQEIRTEDRGYEHFADAVDEQGRPGAPRCRVPSRSG